LKIEYARTPAAPGNLPLRAQEAAKDRRWDAKNFFQAVVARKCLKTLKTAKRKLGFLWFSLAPSLVFLGADLGFPWRPAWFFLASGAGIRGQNH